MLPFALASPHTFLYSEGEAKLWLALPDNKLPTGAQESH
jgi:hypothetical protein